MPGGREVEPPPGSAARMMEERAMADLDATPADFARAGRDLPGARRPVVVPVTGGEPTVAVDGERLILRFSLPAGSYATVLVEELGIEIVRDRPGPGPSPGQGDRDREPSGESESSESLDPAGPSGP
jgi:tRNA(Glu) U13 pseudouridine synthase TruD